MRRIRLDIFKWGEKSRHPNAITVQTETEQGNGTRIAGPQLVLGTGEVHCIVNVWVEISGLLGLIEDCQYIEPPDGEPCEQCGSLFVYRDGPYLECDCGKKRES